MPECISVFILPPSQKALKERLFNRDTDTKEIIAQRLNEAYEDMTHWNEFDYCIINDNFETAAAELEAIFNDEGAISLTDNPALIKKINKILM
jgi:guanylate kinase